MGKETETAETLDQIALAYNSTCRDIGHLEYQRKIQEQDLNQKYQHLSNLSQKATALAQKAKADANQSDAPKEEPKSEPEQAPPAPAPEQIQEPQSIEAPQQEGSPA